MAPRREDDIDLAALPDVVTTAMGSGAANVGGTAAGRPDLDVAGAAASGLTPPPGPDDFGQFRLWDGPDGKTYQVPEAAIASFLAQGMRLNDAMAAAAGFPPQTPPAPSSPPSGTAAPTPPPLPPPAPAPAPPSPSGTTSPRPDLDVIGGAASGRTPPPDPGDGPGAFGIGGYTPGMHLEDYRGRHDREYERQYKRLRSEGMEDGEAKEQAFDNASEMMKGSEFERLLVDIRDAVLEIARRAAEGHGLATGPQQPTEPAAEEEKPEKTPGLWDAVKPLTDRMRGTRVGRAVEGAWGHAKQFLPKPTKKRKPTPKKPSPATGKGGPPKPVPTPGGTAGAAGTGGVGSTAAAGAEAAAVSEAAGAGAAGAGAAGGEAAAAAAGPVGIVVAATLALVELAKAGRDLAYQQEAHARKLAEMSPSQAANVQQLDYQRMVRDFEQGENTAGSSSALMESIDRWEKSIAPIETAITNVSNSVASTVMDNLTRVVEIGDAILEGMKQLPWGVGKAIRSMAEGDGGVNGELFGDFVSRVHQEENAKRAAAEQRISNLKRDRDGSGGFRPW